MNITKIGMNSTTFGIDPRPTYKGDIEVQDLPEIKRSTPKTTSEEKAVKTINDIFVRRKKSVDNYMKYTFKKDRLVRNANDFILRNDAIFTGQTDFILSKEEQKRKLLDDMSKEEKMTFFQITDNKRFGKGISFRLVTAELPDSIMPPTLIEVKRFNLTFDKKRKEPYETELINITDASFNDFCKRAILETDKLGEVFFISKNSEE